MLPATRRALLHRIAVGQAEGRTPSLVRGGGQGRHPGLVRAGSLMPAVSAENVIHVTRQAVFVDQAADAGLFPDAVLLKIDRFG